MKHTDTTIHLGGDHWLTLEESQSIARNGSKVELLKDARDLMLQSLETLHKYADGRTPVYGLNTQFGSQVNLLDVNLTNHNHQDYYDSLKQRQLNLIRSHNCGLGEEAPDEVVRTAMVLRAHCLGLGYSGVRPVVVESLIDFVNEGIHPVIHRYGSIGASGDLIPLSAIAAALAGEEAEVRFQGRNIPAPEALKLAGLSKLQPEGREGLALINGTSFMTAITSLALYDLKRLFPQLLSSIGMALESLMVISSAYHPLVHKLKRQKGGVWVNDFLNKFWKGSQFIQSLRNVREENLRHSRENHTYRETEKGIQDCYSLRSVPQGFGQLHENIDRAVCWIENEMNAVSDNPIVDAEYGEIYQGANFMGYYVTETCDLLKMDISQASSWVHAILANLVHPRKNSGLPANLVPRPEINNGFRPIQLLAASLTVQNRKLAQSHQAYMLPTEGDNQDVNSLATHAAFDFRTALENLERLTAILFLASAQAIELRGIDKASHKARRICKTIRTVSPFLERDRSLSRDIYAVIDLMRDNKI